MALTIVAVPIDFIISSFWVQEVKLPWLYRQRWLAPIHLSLIHYHIYGAMLESYYKLPPKLKTVPEFKGALQLIWSALPERAIDNNTVKYYCKSCRYVCQPTADILNIVIIQITYR